MSFFLSVMLQGYTAQNSCSYTVLQEASHKVEQRPVKDPNYQIENSRCSKLT